MEHYIVRMVTKLTQSKEKNLEERNGGKKVRRKEEREGQDLGRKHFTIK